MEEQEYTRHHKTQGRDGGPNLVFEKNQIVEEEFCNFYLSVYQKNLL